MIGQFKCGCVVSAQFKSEPPADFFDRPCPVCERPPVNPEWAAVGAECKRMRQSAFNNAAKVGTYPQLTSKYYSISAYAKALGVTPSQLCSMERGDMDPAPLVAYWEGQDG